MKVLNYPPGLKHRTNRLLSATGLMLVLVHLTVWQVFPTGGQTATPAWNSVWVPANNLPTPLYAHTATRLENGRVLVAGGISDFFFEESTAFLYDSNTGEWTKTGRMTVDRSFHTATLLADGRVLVVGGFSHDSNGVTPSAEVYDPATRSWRAVARLNRVRACFTATLLANGKVLVAGGEYEGGPSSAELYDAATNTWSMTGDLNVKRWCHVAVLLENGKVLVAGDGAGSAELYDPKTGQWRFVEPLNTPNFSAASATRLADGRVLVTGSGADTLTTAELYDPATAQWRMTAPLALVGGGHTATLLADRQVLLAGGSDLNDRVVGGAELYNPATDTWSPAAHLLTARALHAATLLPDGKVLVTGGVGDFVDDANRRPTGLNSAELYVRIPPPMVRGSRVTGKKLLVFGENFDPGAVILLNGVEQRTRNDPENPNSTLIGMKAGKRIKLGDKLRVRNRDGALSDEYTFQAPGPTAQ